MKISSIYKSKLRYQWEAGKYSAKSAAKANRKRIKMSFPKNIVEMTSQGYLHEGTANCKSCSAPIEWWKTPKGKKIPMDHGTANPHWATCPNAEDFHKPKAGRSTFEANHE